MKVITGESMQTIDRRAIEGLGVPGLTLMEKAGEKCVESIIATYGGEPARKVAVVAGKGNNGGDGYVITRLLRERGWQVALLILARREEISGDAGTNLGRLSESSLAFCPKPEVLLRYVSQLREADIIVDAIFGTGLKSTVRGVYAAAVGLINEAGKPVVAVDIPSGIDANSGKVLGCAVKADLTVTFAFAKIGHILYPGAEFAGRVHVADIGIPPEAAAEVPSVDFLDSTAIMPLLPRRRRDSHKGNYGHCLIIAGSTGKTGAAAMTANSAVRTGAGLVTLAIPARLNPVLEIKTTEAMTFPLPDGNQGRIGEVPLPPLEELLAGRNALALGPGIGMHHETSRVVRRLVEEVSLPMVIDADGLNAISEDPSVLSRKGSDQIILTPHPGEMARLARMNIAEVEADRIGVARKFAAKYRVCLVLKGARTVIATPAGEIALNGSGNPGMASGGMGDVLTGILVALLAQGLSASDASRLGVFVHGLAADLVAVAKGEIGMSAVDVQEMIPFAFKQLAISPQSGKRSLT